MPFRRMLALTAAIAVLIGLPLAADWPVTEKLDLDAIYRIKDEGLQRSNVMEIESYLTDVYGPRLTGSPNMKEAAEWAQKTMKDWGLANVHLESWQAAPHVRARHGNARRARAFRGAGTPVHTTAPA
jgi:carboxypeptidase Q